MKIRVFALPPGFAGEHIRQKFIGMKVPLAPKTELEANPPSPLLLNECREGDYIVRRSDVIEALRAAGSHGAADFWRRLGMGHYLLFAKEVCEVVEA